MDKQPIITEIFVDGEYLGARSDAGHSLLLYVFGPYVKKHVTQASFIDDWPIYIKTYGEQFYPIPLPSLEKLPATLRDRFWSRVRENESKSRQWDQAVYQGYPLYIFGNGDTAYPQHMGRVDDRDLFRPVRVDDADGPSHKDRRIDDKHYGPPPYIGP